MKCTSFGEQACHSCLTLAIPKQLKIIPRCLTSESKETMMKQVSRNVGWKKPCELGCLWAATSHTKPQMDDCFALSQMAALGRNFFFLLSESHFPCVSLLNPCPGIATNLRTPSWLATSHFLLSFPKNSMFSHHVPGAELPQRSLHLSRGCHQLDVAAATSSVTGRGGFNNPKVCVI